MPAALGSRLRGNDYPINRTYFPPNAYSAEMSLPV
jgi:hypothetical protein